jgi:hypothetical protein
MDYLLDLEPYCSLLYARNTCNNNKAFKLLSRFNIFYFLPLPGYHLEKKTILSIYFLLFQFQKTCSPSFYLAQTFHRCLIARPASFYLFSKC